MSYDGVLFVPTVKEEFVVTANQVLGYVEKTFVKKLVSAINKEIKNIRERRFVHVCRSSSS